MTIFHAKIWRYLFNTALPIGLVTIVGYFYKRIICHFATNETSDADLICNLGWKDGLILLFSYEIVKIVSPLLDFDTIVKRIAYMIGLYIIAFGVIAWRIYQKQK